MNIQPEQGKSYWDSRVILVLAFCLINAFFFFVAWRLHDWLSPRHKVLQTVLAPDKATIKHVLFSPDDDVQQTLLTFIAEEKEYIAVAAFSFTNAAIANALIDAARRGVKIELVADEQNSQSSYSKVCLLHNHGIAVWLYPSQRAGKPGKRTGIMHHKFMIFKRSMKDHPILWTGSFNFTRAASDVNQENVIIIDDPLFVNAFLKQFEVLKQRSHVLQGTSFCTN
jgi:mitochondrial cardiolipin hydrolase